MIQQAQGNMTLERLLPDRELPLSCARLPVKNIQLDSRKIQAGDVFIALSAWAGSAVDGHQYVDRAIAAGACAVIFDAPQDSVTEYDIPRVGVVNLAEKLSAMAGILKQNPSAKIPVVAFTGTNGKTTCAQMLAQLYSLMGKNVAVVGTLGAGIWAANSSEPSLEKTGFTTPDAIATQSLLSDLCERGAELVSMEVSSHALEQGRVAALNFDTAVFTNLSHDHLDYHGDMQSYGEVKASLFSFNGLKHAIINMDDEFGADLLKRRNSCQYLSYSVSNQDADVFVSNMSLSAQGVEAQLTTPWGSGQLSSSLLGHFNVSNLLAVIAVACQRGATLDSVLEQIPNLHSAAGRMQSVVVSAAQDISVVVDYAHTPDALESALNSLKALSDKRLTCVFGCGGDRDVAKRAPMGRIASALADTVVLTSDNPRSENPEAIIAAIAAGMQGAKSVHLQSERALAIDIAISQAAAGDTILIAGKGHECEQIFAEHREQFSDVEQAELALRKRAVTLLEVAQ